MKGAKNAALKAVAAALLSRGTWTIANFPDIEDTRRMLELVADLGVEIRTGKGGVEICARNIKKNKLSEKLAGNSGRP